MDPVGRLPLHVLREYALIADGERGALVGPRGDIVWLCAPRWDSDAIFASLIGGAGSYAVTPIPRFVWGGYYERNSLIWRSRWVTEDGIIECREALAFPGDPDRVVVLRRILAVRGDARLSVSLEARTDFGARPFSDLERREKIWIARTGRLRLRWQGADAARPSTARTHRRLEMMLTVPEGHHHDLTLEITSAGLPTELVDPDTAWGSTEAAWKQAVPELDSCLSPSDARHSYAVMRGLTSDSGGMVAAATTSLPESAEAGRNYDYRYVWIRDQCYAGHALAAAGDSELLAKGVHFVADRLLDHGRDLKPAYTATGSRVPDQRELPLPGYPGGFDRIGNWVNAQFQLDAFGEALLLFADAARYDLVDATTWRAAEIAVDAIATRWNELDAGIWEIDNRAWTHSRLTAVAGLRAVSDIPSAAGPRPDWSVLADRIFADTSAHATHPSGHWQRSPDDEGLDGSLLLPPLRGGVPANDPRTPATLAAYRRDLTIEGYGYRFRHDDRPLQDAEGSFTLCGFLMAMATHQQGDRVEALSWWERSRGLCGAPMLYSEEFDTTERQLRGNFPQAFVHAVMLETAAKLV
jgi:hypothetical protein